MMSAGAERRTEGGAGCALLRRLPSVRGRCRSNAPLGPLTWLRVGGAADVLFQPADADDLAGFLAALPPDVPVTVIGAGSNLLVRDGGVRGVVLRLGAAFAGVTAEQGSRIRAAAAAPCRTVARAAMEAATAGLEFLRGIPGGLGGALRMNAGAHSGEMAAILEQAFAVDRQGAHHVLDPAAMGFGYRRTTAPGGLVFVGAVLRGQPATRVEIARRMESITELREASQPTRQRTGGSTFCNPQGTRSDAPRAWQLIDAAGCRGLRRGGAQVSTRHCNFLINTGAATAADLEDLGEDVRARVLAHSGVSLEWEIRRIGEAAP